MHVLRQWLFFWDELAFPLSFVANFATGPEVDALVDMKVLRLFDIQQDYFQINFDPVEFFARPAFEIHRKLDADNPGQWCIGLAPNSIPIPTRGLEQGRELLVELIGAIPVPTAEVSFQEVLEFREERRAELLAFRAHLEGLYLQIVGSPDRALANALAVSNIEQGLKDILRVAKERRFPFRLSDLSARLSVESLVTGFAAGSLSQSLAVGLGTAALQVVASVGLKVSATRPAGPYAYATRIHSDVFY